MRVRAIEIETVGWNEREKEKERGTEILITILIQFEKIFYKNKIYCTFNNYKSMR